MIKLQIVGNLGSDCIQKEVNGKSVVNFNVAHTEKFKDQQGNVKEKTTWVNCAYWTDKTAVAQYLKKGKLVYVEGSPEADAYTNKENQPAATLRLRVRDLQLLSGSNESNPSAPYNSQTSSSDNSGNKPSNMPVGAEIDDAADDLPF